MAESLAQFFKKLGKSNAFKGSIVGNGTEVVDSDAGEGSLSIASSWGVRPDQRSFTYEWCEKQSVFRCASRYGEKGFTANGTPVAYDYIITGGTTAETYVNQMQGAINSQAETFVDFGNLNLRPFREDITKSVGSESALTQKPNGETWLSFSDPQGSRFQLKYSAENSLLEAVRTSNSMTNSIVVLESVKLGGRVFPTVVEERIKGSLPLGLSRVVRKHTLVGAVVRPAASKDYQYLDDATYTDLKTSIVYRVKAGKLIKDPYLNRQTKADNGKAILFGTLGGFFVILLVVGIALLVARIRAKQRKLQS